MKRVMLFSIVTTLLLSGCASYKHRGETEVEIPEHQTTVVRDKIPTDTGRKIPVTQDY